MTETTMGREPIQIVEIVQPLCALTYGTSPCTAAIGVTGTDRCFNTRKTCQDPANFDGSSSVTLRFGRPNSALPVGEAYIIPSLRNVSASPTIINAAGGSKDQKPLGVRGSVSVTLQDAPHTDRLVDPYRTLRSYDPLQRSTFWAKWLARNPFYQNRTLRVLDGYAGQALAAMQVREYIIDQVSGPDSNGRVSIRARDVLSLADDRKAQAPVASTGELIEDEPAGDTTLRVTGAVAADYPAPGLVRVNDELITYTGISTISGTEINLTGCARGTNGTTADGHSAEDRVQLCLQYSGVNAADIADDLLRAYAGIGASFIDSAGWASERDGWLAGMDFSAIITEPVGVTELLGELSEQGLFYIWWDERAQLIKLRAVRPATETPTAVNDNGNILADSVGIMEEPKERVSQVWVFWGQRDTTQPLDEERNFSRIRVRADLDAESADQYGEQVIRKVYSRWLATEGQALRLSSRMLARYRNNPQYVTLALDAKDRALWTGDICDVTHRNIVDQYGEQVTTRYQVLSADEVDSGHVVQYKLLRFEFVGRFSFIMDAATAPDFTAASEDEKNSGCWIASASTGKMSDGSDPYTIQ